MSRRAVRRPCAAFVSSSRHHERRRPAEPDYEWCQEFEFPRAHRSLLRVAGYLPTQWTDHALQASSQALKSVVDFLEFEGPDIELAGKIG
jgi:hypothetical protein